MVSKEASQESLHGLSVALVHWPVLDRQKNTVVTNVTNFDIQDIARACRVYGVDHYYIVNRMQEQLMFVERVLDHWRVGYGSKFNPMRKTALGMVRTKETLQDVLRDWEGERPFIVATAARDLKSVPGISFQSLKKRIQERKSPILLVFGTGFGLEEGLLQECDALLEPIRGASSDNYRHLSVRSAVSICLDRLLATW